jgi:integrase
MTLRELLHDRIAPLKNLSARSVTMYDASLDRFRDFLGHEPGVEDLDDLVMSKFLRWRSTTVHDARRGLISPASLAKDSAHLRSLWTWLARKRWKKANGELLEFPDYARPRVPRPRPSAYTVEELQQLLTAARHRRGYISGVPACWYWTTKLMAMFQTGERIGAVLAIRWGEVDLDRHCLTFLAATRKGHHETITRAISPELCAVMAPQRRAVDALVWPWLEARKPLSIYPSLKVLCNTAGVPYHPFHSIRKSTASYLKKAGKSAKTQLGHSSEEMAEHHYYDERITGTESALDYLPPLDLDGPGKPAA